MNIKAYTYLLILILFTSACKTNKNVVSGHKSQKELSTGNIIKGERIFFSGLKEKVKDNYPEAVKQFEKAIKLNPKIDAAYYEIALIKYSQNDYQTALKNIESAIKIDQSNKWYRELYAELLSANRKYDRAALVYKKLREEKPHNVDYYYSEAFFLIKQNKLKEALKVYNLLETKIGIQEEISNEKFLIHIKDSDYKKAEAELNKLSEAYPTNLKYLNKLASFQLSNNKPEKAIEIFKKILEVNPNDTKALMSLADYYNQKGDTEKYKEYSKKAFLNKNINIDTKITIIYTLLQESEKDKTKLKEAYEYVELLVDTHPEDAKVWAIYGDIYNLDEKPKEALIKYNKSLEIRKDIFSVWQQVFFIETDLKNFDNLIKTTESAKEYFPNQALVYYFNGIGFQQNKDFTNAIESFEKGVKMAGKNQGLKSQFYSNLGEANNEIKDYKKSDESFEKSLSIDPNNHNVLNNYAYYLSLRSDKLERAKEMSLKSLVLSPDNPTYLDTYAWVLFKNNEFKDAFKHQEKAIKLSDSPSAALFEHLGDMLFKLSRTEEAVDAWKKAKDKGGNSQMLDEKIENKKIN